MILVTGCNERYFPRMAPYLDSLRTHADFSVYLVGVGFVPPVSEGAHPLQLSRADNHGAPKETESIQHGSFMKVLTASPDTVIMYTDGDFIMQRPLSDQEKQFLKLKHNQAVVQWNGGSGETLGIEAQRLGQKIPHEEMSQIWGDGWEARPIYNVGLLAMTAQTWRDLHGRYMAWWDSACHAFTHQARQQWLISYLIDVHCQALVAPWHLHAHGHFGMKPGMERRPDGIYADGKKALFRHYL